MDLNDPKQRAKWRAWEKARWEAVERVKAQELAAMTNERAQEIIQGLGAVESWQSRRDWSGLIEQQLGSKSYDNDPPLPELKEQLDPMQRFDGSDLIRKQAHCAE